jgi:hypothetical protein
LTEDVDDFISVYEYQYPSQQSTLVRRHLILLKDTMEQIKREIDYANARAKYEELIALVYHVGVALQEQCREFTMLLVQRVLNKHAYDKAESLGKYNVDVSVKAIDLSENQLLQREVNAYEAAIQQYNTAYRAYQPDHLIYQSAELFKEEIEKEKRSDGRDVFDYKYYTKLFTAAADMISHPQNSQKMEAFDHFLGFNTAGKSNRALRWRGVGMMLIGAIVIGGGVALCVSTLGALTPVTLVVAGMGAAVAAAGAALIFMSREKGVEKSAVRLRSNSIFSREQEVVETAPLLQQGMVL